MLCLLHARDLIWGFHSVVPSTFSIPSYNPLLFSNYTPRTSNNILSSLSLTTNPNSPILFNILQNPNQMSTSNPTTSCPSGGGGSSGGGGGVNVGGGGPCGACKFLRRKCVAGCIFAPYFDSDQGAAHFAAVHKVFGASNVSKLLTHLPVQRRHDAVVTVCYEAQARLRDPVFGCVSHIFALQQQVVNLQAELAYYHAHLAAREEQTPPPPPPPPQPAIMPQALSINDLTAATPFLGAYDLASLLEPMQVPPSWTMQPQMRQMDPRQFMSFGTARGPPDLPLAQGSSGDFQELARELFQRTSNESAGPGACKTEGSSLPP